MAFNICQIIILVSILQGCLYITALLFLPRLRTKANFFLAMLILAFVGNLGQYWLRDVGIISDYTLQLIFLPWQILVAPMFLLYVRTLQVINLRSTPHYLLWAPIVLVVLGHLIIKIYLLATSVPDGALPGWIAIFNIAEEYISILYCIVVSIVAFRNIFREKKLTNYKGFGVNQDIIKWIRLIAYMGLILCGIWLVSLFLFDQGALSNYYVLWVLSAFVLNVLGLNGIYNSLKEGPYTMADIATTPSEIRRPSSLNTDMLHQKTLFVAAPMKYFDQRLIDALITLSTTLSEISDIDTLQYTFKNWILQEFDIAGIHLTDTVSSNELKGIAQMSEDQQELTIPFRNIAGQLGSFSVIALDDKGFHQRHLYYLKMAAKAYSFHLGQFAKRPIQITDDNPHYQSLSKLMKDEQLYLDAELDLYRLAQRLDISTGYLSKMINSVTGLGFSEYVNRHRIEHVKQLMGDSAYDHYSIIGYGYEAGFNSKSTFYKAFAKIVGQSPGAYKKDLEQGLRRTMY